MTSDAIEAVRDQLPVGHICRRAFCRGEPDKAPKKQLRAGLLSKTGVGGVGERLQVSHWQTQFWTKPIAVAVVDARPKKFLYQTEKRTRVATNVSNSHQYHDAGSVRRSRA